ncbi:MAG: hypothetical protein E7358_00310 [Clostridiales bacterium]|nr:hypothetical protein [Clostridiales bacterium]
MEKKVISEEEYIKLLKKKSDTEIENFKPSDAFFAKLNKNTKTMQLMRNFDDSKKRFLILKNALAIKYTYTQKVEYLLGDAEPEDKRVCHIDLIIKRDNMCIGRFDETGITMTELKKYSHYYLKFIRGKDYYLSTLYEQLKGVEEKFMKTMDEDKNFEPFVLAFNEYVELRAQSENNVQYGTTREYLIAGARISACKAPVRYVPMPDREERLARIREFF